MHYHFQPPVPGPITQEPNPEHVNATDFACRVGTPVKAVISGSGTVKYSTRLGWVFTLTSLDKKATVTYAHLDVASPPGFYEEGSTIGLCGNTGSWTTGPHVHFEADVPYSF